MAGRKQKEAAFLGGELVGWLLANLPAAVWSPGDLPKGAELNPFRDKSPVSEEMQKHLEGWARDKWRGMVDASAK